MQQVSHALMEGRTTSWSHGFYDGKHEAFVPKLLGNECALHSLPFEDHHLKDEDCRRILRGVWAMKDQVQDALSRPRESTAQPAPRTCSLGQIVRLSFALWQDEILTERHASCPTLERRGRHGRDRRWQSQSSPLGPLLESPPMMQFNDQAVVGGRPALPPTWTFEGGPALPPTWTMNEAGALQFASLKMKTEERRQMNDELVKELAVLTMMLQRGKIITTTGKICNKVVAATALGGEPVFE